MHQEKMASAWLLKGHSADDGVALPVSPRQDRAPTRVSGYQGAEPVVAKPAPESPAAGSVVEADNRAKYVAFKDLVGPAKEMVRRAG